MNIAETVVNHGSCETLAAALTAADLVATLSSKDPFTLFAPIDDAFGKLPEGTLEILLSKIMSTDLSDGMKATTVNGEEVTVNLKEVTVFINDAEVVLVDVTTDNGVIHAVNKVIMAA